MKIKAWLLITFFIVMILPIGGAYGLYMWINDYYQDKSVGEYIEKWAELNTIKAAIDDPTLYVKNADLSDVEALSNNQLGITLYSKMGFVFYTSNPVRSGFVSQENLFKGLYEFQQQYNTFTYKEPVYQKG